MVDELLAEQTIRRQDLDSVSGALLGRGKSNAIPKPFSCLLWFPSSHEVSILVLLCPVHPDGTLVQAQLWGQVAVG